MTKFSEQAYRQIAVFLASPGDVSRERQYVEDVIAELNRSVAAAKRVFLQTRRWDIDTFPAQGKDAQAVVNSQIADMSRCDLFVGIMWNRLGTKTRRAKSGTVEEYERAMASLKRHGRPEVWFYFRDSKLVMPSAAQLRQLQQVNVFKARVKREGLPSSYRTPTDFRDRFRAQLSLWLSLIVSRSARSKSDECRINPYKLFYFRQTHKLSFTALAKLTGISRPTLRRLEKVRVARGALDASRFPAVEYTTLMTLERHLDCNGKLRGGLGDDFLSQYMLFYQTYKGSAVTRRSSETSAHRGIIRFRTQAVVFDFGGTLTHSAGQYTTWEKLWRTLGYSVNRCSELHRSYQGGKITHQEWCDLTCKAFRLRRLTERQVKKIAQRTKLVPGVARTVIELRRLGIKLYIVSGSLKLIIRSALGSLCDEFEEIRANDMVFDRKGIVSRLHSTPYDFQGKAEFLRRVIREQRIDPLDVLFVGNSCNDVFASQAGVRTLCVNPRFTDPDKQEHWTYAIREMQDFGDILPYVTM